MSDMAKVRRKDVFEIQPYPLSEDEKAILQCAQDMPEIYKEAAKKTKQPVYKGIYSTLLSTLPPLPPIPSPDLLNKIAIKHGYKGYDIAIKEKAHVINMMIFAYKWAQQNLMSYNKIIPIYPKNKRPPHRFQYVGNCELHSRFEIDVWRGIYRFVLKNRGCYDPTLSFKELRKRFPLTEEELSATAQLTRWIACKPKNNWEAIFPACTERVIKSLISPGVE